jgi:uncharacterized protein (TIGR02453 family)
MATTPRLKPTRDFLLVLQDNNNKPWFQAHRAEYETARQCFEDFVDNIIQEFRSIEDFENLSAKDCIFRIYRDVRFSKDKAPYKPNMGASVALGGKHSPRLPAHTVEVFAALKPLLDFLNDAVLPSRGASR